MSRTSRFANPAGSPAIASAVAASVAGAAAVTVLALPAERVSVILARVARSQGSAPDVQRARRRVFHIRRGRVARASAASSAKVVAIRAASFAFGGCARWKAARRAAAVAARASNGLSSAVTQDGRGDTLPGGPVKRSPGSARMTVRRQPPFRFSHTVETATSSSGL